MIKAVLLDIEGTTTSISFVYDTLFPYARLELGAFLERAWNDDEVAAARDQVARDAGHESFAAWKGGLDRETQQHELSIHLLGLMDDDVKSTGLKTLQGLVWARGYERGELQGHVFDDVPEALRRWKAEGTRTFIFSSGSIAAQKLLFAHSIHGDLLPLIEGHYDTTAGPKRAPESYRLIAEDIGIPADDILFCSDVPGELDAAMAAGMQTRLMLRPGNPPVESACPRRTADDFTEI